MDFAAAPGKFENAGEIVKACMQRGVLINGVQGNVLRIAPALTIEADEFDRGLDVLEDVLNG